MTLKSYYLSHLKYNDLKCLIQCIGPHADEMTHRVYPAASSAEKILIPAGNLFLKHYYYLSFEEFLLQKASNKFDSDGERPNVYALYPRDIWNVGNFTESTKVDLGAAHTAAMAAKVRARLEANTEKNPLVASDTCRRLWDSPSLSTRRRMRP